MAAVLFSSTMSQNNTTTTNVDDDVKPTIFHDFLGRQCAPLLHCAAADGGSSPSPSASRAGGAPVSATSDLDSDRQLGSHLEGIPFYGQKNDFSPSGISNRYAGNKRSNSDSVSIGSSKDRVPQIRPDFPENSHLMKVLSNIGQQEQLKRPHQAEAFMAAYPIRPTSKWERAIPVNVGPVLQYPPRAGQAVPYSYQTLSNRFKDANVGSAISQSAADQGSRTGIKGSGILSSINVNGGLAEPAIGKLKSAINVPEPGSSSPLRWKGSTSTSRQMTIFYGGQAHVFDDVHPNKADAIMALAGSTGASWSTSYLNSAIKPTGGETIPATGESSGMASGNSGLPRGRLYVSGSSSPRGRSMLHGGHGGVLMADARRPTTRSAAEPSIEEKP